MLPVHVTQVDRPLNTPSTALPAQRKRAFASFANRDFRIYWAGVSSAMMADNIEHVISYWVMFQKFHSPSLGAFAVVSHWIPYLLLAGFSGSLADRFDIRRLIQISMALFALVSVGWGLMFLTDSLTEPRAMVLLVLHGLAGVILAPASQVMIHKIVDTEQLPSAVRLVATGRYLAFLLGPAIGASVLLALLGPTLGIFINALIYLPLAVWLIRAPYGPNSGAALRPAQRIRGLRDVIATMAVVRRHQVLLAMTVLVGAASFFVGNAYQAQMPGFAEDLGHGHPGFAYSALLAADATGGLTAGILLEAQGLLPPSVRTAFVLAMVWSVALAGFAMSSSYAVAIPMLFIAGFVELGFNSMAQSLVQLNAPADIRGRVIGVFSMAAMGLRTFSGLSVGLLGQAIGIHHSLGLSAVTLFALYLVMYLVRIARAR
jgi:MFS family permease